MLGFLSGSFLAEEVAWICSGSSATWIIMVVNGVERLYGSSIDLDGRRRYLLVGSWTMILPNPNTEGPKS
jgi:hypothetical protein